MKKKITKINKDGNESNETISCKIKFVDSVKFMTTLLSKLVDNLTEGIHKIKYKHCNSFFEYERVKDDLIKYKCLSYSKSYSKKVDFELKK